MTDITEKSKSRIYIEETTESLIEKYKDVIEKTFQITDKDLLQDEIENEDQNQKEARLLESLKKRRVSLDEVDIILDKIDKLERRLNPNNEAGAEIDKSEKKNWTKRVAAENK